MFSKKEIAKIQAKMQNMSSREQVAFIELKKAEKRLQIDKERLAQAKRNMSNAVSNAKTDRQCAELEEIIKSLK